MYLFSYLVDLDQDLDLDHIVINCNAIIITAKIIEIHDFNVIPSPITIQVINGKDIIPIANPNSLPGHNMPPNPSYAYLVDNNNA